jgi:protein-disulfide isomerase
MQWTVVVFLFACVRLATLDPINPPIPVSDVEAGFRYAPAEPRPAVKWEFFADLVCPDAAVAWPIALQIQQYYGASRLDLVWQTIPLPYHRSGFIAHQGLLSINEHTPDYVFDYVDIILANHDALSTANTANNTELQTLEIIADFAVEATGIDKDLFKTDLYLQKPLAATGYKYAIKRGVAASPTYFVNGVDVVVGTNYVPTFDEWIAFFDTLIA